MPLVGQSAEEFPKGDEAPIDSGDGLALFPQQVFPKVGDVSHSHPFHGQRFFVGRREPVAELPHVLGKRSTAVRGQIVAIEELSEQEGFIPGDRDASENIIARILAALFVRIRRHFDTSPG